MQDKKLLIFHPYLATYRIDLYNALSKALKTQVLLTGGKKELAELGFDLQEVNHQAGFSHQYYSKGLYFGRHLISFIYYKVIKKFKPNIIMAHELGINTLFAIVFKSWFKYKILSRSIVMLNKTKHFINFAGSLFIIFRLSVTCRGRKG